MIQIILQLLKIKLPITHSFIHHMDIRVVNDIHIDNDN